MEEGWNGAGSDLGTEARCWVCEDILAGGLAGGVLPRLGAESPKPQAARRFGSGPLDEKRSPLRGFKSAEKDVFAGRKGLS